MKLNNCNILFKLEFDDSDLENRILNSEFIYEYIPNLKQSDEENTDFTLKIKKGLEININLDEKISEITYTEKVSDKDLITLIEYVMEYYRQTKGIYCIHGALSSKNNIGVVFFGQVSGLGKTITAVNLSNKFGFNFLGDEKILIKLEKEKILAASTNKLKYNKNYIKDYINLDESEVINNHKIEWVELKYLIQPQISEGGKLLFDKWENPKTEFHLYEEISRKIRGCSRRVINFDFPVQSIDTQTLSFERINFCREFSKIVTSYHVVGDINLVSEFINNQIEIN